VRIFYSGRTGIVPEQEVPEISTMLSFFYIRHFKDGDLGRREAKYTSWFTGRFQLILDRKREKRRRK
jgi:hypothetical protein